VIKIKNSKIYFFAFLLLVLLTGAMFFVSIVLFFPQNSKLSQTQKFAIKKNETIKSVASRLHEAGLIRHPVVFRFVVWRGNLDTRIQAGSFELSPSMSARQIAEKLTQGVDDVWISFNEGLRVEEMADLLETEAILEGFNKEAFIAKTKPNEGYLFPDTYLVPKTMEADGLADLMLKTFDDKVKNNWDKLSVGTSRNLEEVVIMASIVQRESGADQEEMAHIAGILWNRVDNGWGLFVDCTLQYMAGFNKSLKTWWAPPQVEFKSSSSAFNTYKFKGLPPSPIANPGLAAIKAAAQPLPSGDFYYLHAPDGKIHYAKDLVQHNNNINKYLKN